MLIAKYRYGRAPVSVIPAFSPTAHANGRYSPPMVDVLYNGCTLSSISREG
jgi:hypothetical protein